MSVVHSAMSVAGHINRVLFGIAAACLLAMAVLLAVLVGLRYGLGMSVVTLQEMVMYLHALVLALGLAGAWQSGAHVRIDILYRSRPVRWQRRVERVGMALLAVPFALFILWSCAEYVAVAWQRQEGSAEPGGLAYLWLLKTLLLVFPVQLLLAVLWLWPRAPLPGGDQPA
ncbi:MAG: TRAP transporter small permease subunit [Oceanococcaceae bacterium]